MLVCLVYHLRCMSHFMQCASDTWPRDAASAPVAYLHNWCAISWKAERSSQCSAPLRRTKPTVGLLVSVLN